MKKFLFAFPILMISCVQNKNPKESTTIAAKTLPADTVVITDSFSITNYLVSADTAYFFTTPESGSKSKQFVTENNLVYGYQTNGDYTYSIQMDSGAVKKGWLKIKDLEKIAFTPPKIVKEE